MTPLLVIVGGPTASGKTALAIQLAQHFNTVIISADSRQFYKELTIGTAKPSVSELSAVPHYFINSNSITEPVNAGNFGIEVNELLKKLFSTHQVVILAGGSGLFIDAVINGIDDLPAASDEIRKQLNSDYINNGIESLQQQLKKLDPDGYTLVDINNPRRLTRALEITLSTGIPYSALIGKKNNESGYRWLMTGIDWPRELLYERINIRTIEMIKNGLVKEVSSLSQYRNLNALSTVGYKEIFEYLDGNITLEEATEKIARHTRNYAKRQLTWFRRYEEMIWIKDGEEQKLIKMIEEKIKEKS